MSKETDNPENLGDMLEEELDNEEQPSETGEEEEEEEEEEEAGKEGEEEQEEGDEQKKEEDDSRIPEKFKGKSAAEIAEAYTNLEGMITQKAMNLAQTMMGGKKPDEEARKKAEEEEDIGLTDEEIKKMTPKQFVQHMRKLTDQRAQKIVADTIARQNEVRTNIRREIKAATKDHPHLKTNQQYRSIVLDIIDARKARGETITLKKACEEADSALNIKPEDKPKVNTKKKRAQVETTDGPAGKKDLDDEEKVKAGILGASQSTPGLGGLGV